MEQEEDEKENKGVRERIQKDRKKERRKEDNGRRRRVIEGVKMEECQGRGRGNRR